jgi:hypothetical protein
MLSPFRTLRSLAKIFSVSLLALTAAACASSDSDSDGADSQESNIDVRNDQAVRAKEVAGRAASSLQPLAQEIDHLSLGADNESIDVLTDTLKRTQKSVNELRPIVEELLQIVSNEQRITDSTTLRATVDKERLMSKVVNPLRTMVAPANQGGTLFAIQRTTSDINHLVMEAATDWGTLQERADFAQKKAAAVAAINDAVSQATTAFNEINSWTFHRGQMTLEHTLEGLYCIGQESSRGNDDTAQGGMNGRCNALATKVALYQFTDDKIKVSLEPVQYSSGYETVQNYSAPRREQAARRGLARMRIEAQGSFRIESEVKRGAITAEGLPNPPKTALSVATYQNWMSKCFAEMDATTQRFRWSLDRKRFLLSATCSAPVVTQRPASVYQPNQPAKVAGDVTYVWAVFE